jgi:hypothetical protein
VNSEEALDLNGTAFRVYARMGDGRFCVSSLTVDRGEIQFLFSTYIHTKN